MKKVVAESLNEWNPYKDYEHIPELSDESEEDLIDDVEDPLQNVYDTAKELTKLFKELGFDDAQPSGLGGNDYKMHIAIMCEKVDFEFTVKDDDVYFDGTDQDRSEKRFLGNLNDPEKLKQELEKILV